MMELLSKIFASIGSFFTYKSSANKQRRDAEKDVSKRQAAIEAKKDEIRQAVYSHDDEKLNEICAKILMVMIVVVTIITIGCQSAVVYVPTDRRIESCTNSLGIACKAVPDAVFCELLEKAQELKDLKAEIAVDKRLTK